MDYQLGRLRQVGGGGWVGSSRGRGCKVGSGSMPLAHEVIFLNLSIPICKLKGVDWSRDFQSEVCGFPALT